MTRPTPRSCVAVLMLLLIAAPLTAAPTTAPAGGARTAFVGRLVANLSDADPAAREAARRALLGLDVDDLDALAEAVADLRAEQVTPATGRVLFEVARHLRLGEAKRAYHRQPTPPARDPFGRPLAEAFLGIGPLEVEGLGLVVRNPLAGFAAYEVLEHGDVLLSIAGADFGPVPVRDFDTLQQVLRVTSPGARVALRVVRGGEVLRLPFRLDRRAETNNSELWRRLSNEAERRAESDWTERLRPALARAAASGQSAAGPAAASGPTEASRQSTTR